MKTKISGKMLTVLTYLEIVLFGAAMIFAQTPRLRANGKIAFTIEQFGAKQFQPILSINM